MNSKTPHDARLWSDRWKRIHIRLLKGNQVTCSMLAEELGCSDRTVTRDLKAMRELGLPIEYVPEGHTWCYRQPMDVVNLDTRVLTREERLSLCLIRLLARQYRGSVVFERAELLLERLFVEVESTGAVIRDEFDALEQMVTFEGRPVPEIDEDIYDAVLSAILDKTWLRIVYDSPNKGLAERIVIPIGLQFLEGKLFLIGYDKSSRLEPRTFYLPRIESAEEVERVTHPKDIKDYMSQAVGGRQTYGKAEHVVLRFTLEGTQHAEGYVLQSEQQTYLDDEGRRVIELQTAAFFQIEREVLNWGGQLEVLSPDSLRNSIKVAAQRLLKEHSRSE